MALMTAEQVIMTATTFACVCYTGVNSLDLSHLPTSSPDRIDCSGVAGVNLTHDQCLHLDQKGIDAGVCRRNEITGDIFTCPCAPLMTKSEAVICHQRCPRLFEKCQKVRITTLSQNTTLPTTKAPTTDQSPTYTDGAVNMTTSGTNMITDDSILPQSGIELGSAGTGLLVAIILLSVAAFAGMLSCCYLVRSKFNKCPAPCCNCDTDCWFVKALDTCFFCCKRNDAQVVQPRQVEDNDDVERNPEEMQMVEPAYRLVDPPNQDANMLP